MARRYADISIRESGPTTLHFGKMDITFKKGEVVRTDDEALIAFACAHRSDLAVYVHEVKEPPKQEPLKQEPLKQEPLKQEPLKQEPAPSAAAIVPTLVRKADGGALTPATAPNPTPVSVKPPVPPVAPQDKASAPTLDDDEISRLIEQREAPERSEAPKKGKKGKR